MDDGGNQQHFLKFVIVQPVEDLNIFNDGQVLQYIGFYFHEIPLAAMEGFGLNISELHAFGKKYFVMVPVCLYGVNKIANIKLMAFNDMVSVSSTPGYTDAFDDDMLSEQDVDLFDGAGNAVAF